MREIKLSRGMFALVDDGDFPWLDRFKWSVSEPMPGKFYAVRNERDPTKKRGYRSISMHRYILNLHDRPFIEVDHEDNDGLNNQRSNLRTATRSQNGQNRKPFKGRKYKGVYPRGKSGFGAYITEDSKTKYLGSFITQEEAARAYDARARVLHGKFAKLNFPDPLPT